MRLKIFNIEVILDFKGLTYGSQKSPTYLPPYFLKTTESSFGRPLLGP